MVKTIERFDVIILGAGPGGEVAAEKLNREQKRVALIERELLGGDCAYWACIPSKTLLRPVTVISEARHVPGVTTPHLNTAQVTDYRDQVIRHLDDSQQYTSYTEQGITVIRGAAKLRGPGQVQVGEQIYSAPDILIATGSSSRIPAIEGLREAGYWTNREATTFSSVPESIVIIGGGPQSIELAQLMRLLGATVTLVVRGQRILKREEPELSTLLEKVLERDGVLLRLGRQARRVKRENDGVRTVELDDGSSVCGQELLIATGRVPTITELGLENTGVQVTERGITVDEHCQAAPGIWAVGDVTGVAMFTHIAKYQARIAADAILGHARPACYNSVPRVVFSDPEVAGVGLTTEQAHTQGREVCTATVDLAQAIARPVTYGTNIDGRLGLIADRQRGILIGAWAIGPEVGEWIHQAVQAIRAEIPINVLRDTIPQFPTFSEAYLYAVEKLAL
jgi:dihydrolipoamide dehydrogenase